MQLHHLADRLRPCFDGNGDLDAAKLRQLGFNDIAHWIERGVDDDLSRTTPYSGEHDRKIQPHAQVDAAPSLNGRDAGSLEPDAEVDYWKEAIWSAAERQGRQEDQLKHALNKDGFRFAVRFAQFRNGNSRHFFPVAEAMRGLLRRHALPTRDAFAWSLALEQCDAGSEAEFPKFAQMLEAEHLSDICSLFRKTLGANTAAFSAFAEVLRGMKPSDVQLSGRAIFNFLVLAYGLLEYSRFLELCTYAVRWPALDTADGPRTPQGAALAIATAHLKRRTARTTRTSPIASRQEVPQRSLRIALCVSGQLRGWRQAHETWRHLQLEGHEVDIFVHTWRKIGISMPVASARKGVDRIFKHGPFVRAFIEAGQRFGDEAIATAYPRFMAALASGTTDASVDELRAVLGKSATIVVEDEMAEFDDDPMHQGKMFYKILAADELARSAGPYDLHVRLRPDLTFLAPSEPVNWPAVLRACETNNTLLAGRPYVTNNVLVDDRFAIGTPEQMRIFAQTRQTLSRATAQRWYGFPRHLRAHCSAAWTLLYQAMGTAELPVRPGPLVGVKVWEKAETRSALLADLPEGPRTAMDQLLLNALG